MLSQEQVIEIREEIAQAIASQQIRLPSAPEIYRKVMYAIDNDSDLREVEHLINVSPALAVRVLQVANSAAYYGKLKLSSIQTALGRLGLSMVKSVVLCACMHDYYEMKDAELDAIARKQWEHSVDLAVKTYTVSRNFDILRPDIAMSCSILHDIGFLPLIHYVAQHRELLPHMDQLMTETVQVFGLYMCSYWQLGEDITQCVHLHSGKVLPFTGSVQYSDLLGLIHALTFNEEENVAELEERCGFGRPEYEALMDEFAPEIAAFRSSLGLT